jgi:hypothetical protein
MSLLLLTSPVVPVVSYAAVRPAADMFLVVLAVSSLESLIYDISRHLLLLPSLLLLRSLLLLLFPMSLLCVSVPAVVGSLCFRWLHAVVGFPAVPGVPAIVGISAVVGIPDVANVSAVNGDPDVALALFAAVLKSQIFWTIDLLDFDYRTENFSSIGLSIIGPVP